MLSLPPRRLAREGVPIAVILLFWYLLASIARIHDVGGAVRNAGIVMATLYVVVRGAGLASEAVGPVTGDPEAVLRENARLAVPAGAWFLGAMVVGMVESYVYEFTWVIASVGGALAGAGLGVVALYAVAVGFSAFGRGASSDVSRANDRASNVEDGDAA